MFGFVGYIVHANGCTPARGTLTLAPPPRALILRARRTAGVATGIPGLCCTWRVYRAPMCDCVVHLVVEGVVASITSYGSR